MTCEHPCLNVQAKTCRALMTFSVFRPLVQMADCGGMPQVDQVRTSARHKRSRSFVGVLFMLSSRLDNRR